VGVVCTDEGIVIRNPFRNIALQWDEIERFDIHPGRMLGNTAWAHTRDGSRVHIFGIVANMSRRAARDARPLVDALNARLAAQRECSR